MEPEVLEIPVVSRRDSLFSLTLKAAAVVLPGILLMASLIAREREAEEVGWIFLFSALFGIFLIVLIVSSERQSRLPGALRVEPDLIRWRPGTTQAGEVALPYTALWAAHKEGRGQQERLVLKARENMAITIRTAFLPEAGAADSVLEAVRDRVRLLPEGPRRLDDQALRQAVAARISSERKTAVLAISILLGLAFLAELATGALASPFRLLDLGVNSFPLVKNGELFRLATANVLHGSLLHLLFNVMALATLGSLLEPLLGKGRFLSVLLISALAGAAASAFLGHHTLSLGASTGIAGLIAAYAVVLWRWPNRLSNPPTKGTWFMIAFAFLWPAMTFQNVDHMAHLGGFLAGFALVFPETRKVELVELANHHRAFFRVTAALLVALFVVAGGMAIRREGDPDRDLEAAAILLRDPSVPALMLNSLAWQVATNPDASRQQLALALQGIENAVKEEPKKGAFRDTRATVLYRLGRWQEAVRAEYSLLARDRTPFHVSQLARFEWALVKAEGPLILGQPPNVLPRARIDPGASIVVETGDPQFLQRATLHFVLSRKQEASALLQIKIGVIETSGTLRHSLPRDLAVLKPDTVSLALVDTKNTRKAPRRTQWKFEPVVPEAARLP